MSLGQSYKHDSAVSHVTGESVFIDDRPFHTNEVLVFVKGAPASCGKILNIKIDKALKVPGVVGIWTGDDFAHNQWGTIVSEQPVLARKQIGYFDEPICIVAAESKISGQMALELIEVEIESMDPILSLQEAIDKKNFLYESTPFLVGEPELVYQKSEHQLEGTFECGGQEHFYLESQAAIVYPQEDGHLEVHSSSQHPTETQHVIAKSLGLQSHQVTCIVKRMGGAFGGKESQAAPFAAMAALVAQKLKRPARLVLSKDDDMKMTGKRHPFLNFYKVGFNQEGVIQSLMIKLYANAGAYVDLSPSILDRALFHADGAYFIANAKFEGWACRTNQHSNTAFRGFGGPQGNMTVESIIEDIAKYLKIDALLVRQRNCYSLKPRNITPYGQEIDDQVLVQLFKTLEQKSDYYRRRQEVSVFNQDKKQRKLRGLSVTAVKFGIAFTARHLNQASALVHLYLDGSVQVSTGATEMGQGVNTKIKQTVATCLGLSMHSISVMATSTEKNANTSPTAASSGADLNCSAVWKACDQIRRRLAYLFYCHQNKIEFQSRELTMPPSDFIHEDYVFHDGVVLCLISHQKIALIELIQIAYLNRISLSELAHYRTEGIGFDKKTGKGRPFHYFTNGVAASEVEVDEDTGQVKVRRVDILMDLGASINPKIDLGQVTGGFIQGVGWVTSENLYYAQNGSLISHSPTTYKIPNIQDTPRIFNVELFPNALNQRNIYSSKAVGEPPLLLATSVWTAIKDALSYRSKEKIPFLRSPALPSEILIERHRYEQS